MGTALAWTTDDKTNENYSSLNNGLGDHFWVLDMDMDCSETENGWFEFTALYSHGGEQGEPDLSQGVCQGDSQETEHSSTKHVAKCGEMNIYIFGESACELRNMPCSE